MAVVLELYPRKPDAVHVDRAENMGKTPAVEILPDLPVFNGNPSHQSRIGKRAGGVDIGGHRQELIAVLRIVAHLEHRAVIEPERVRNRFHDGLARPRRFAAATDHTVGEAHRIKPVFPKRHRFDERIALPERVVDIAAPAGQIAGEIIVGNGNLPVDVSTDEFCPEYAERAASMRTGSQNLQFSPRIGMAVSALFACAAAPYLPRRTCVWRDSPPALDRRYRRF